MDSALAVAIVAALASLGAAFWAYRSAKGARDSADAVYSKNHQISVIDRDADELRQAYRALLQKIAEHEDGVVMESHEALGEFELLMAARAADHDLELAAKALQKAVQASGYAFSSDSNRDWLRATYANCQRRLADERAAVLAPVRRRR